MKNFALFIMLCAFFFAYTQKNVLGVMPFSVSSNYSKDEGSRTRAQSVEDMVSAAFQKSNRFTLVERSKMNAIKAEREIQKGEDFIDSKAIELSAALGAQYIVTGNISVANIEKTEYYGGMSCTYSAGILFDIKVLDVSTSEVVAAEHFKGEGSSTAFNVSGEHAFNVAITKVEEAVEKFIQANFPLQLPIVEVQEKTKSGDAKTLLVAGGTSVGIKKGDIFKVCEIQMIEVEGKKIPRKKEIGQMKIVEIEDENFSISEITKGAKEIAEKMGAGKTLKGLIIQ